MTRQTIDDVLVGCHQALTQGHKLLSAINDSQYCYIAKPLSGSSIGQHFRHMLDMWKALFDQIPDGSNIMGLVDYDFRRRGHSVECDRSVALDEIQMTMARVESMRETLTQDRPLEVKSEVGLESMLSATVNSTLCRELIFVSSHASHHYALIRIIVMLQGVKIDEQFGMAPATRTYVREVAK